MKHIHGKCLNAMVCAILAAATCLAMTLADAADYPDKLIKLTVPVTPGGTTDLLARTLAERLTRSLGQTVVVENRPGANGNIGMDFVAHAAPDGYNLLLGTSNLATNQALYPKLSFDPLKDFAPVSLYASVGNVLVIDPALPIKSLKELIAYANAHPGELTHASNGSGSTSHLSAELIKSRTGINMTHVPYKGGAPAMTALIGGHTSMLFDQIPVVLSYIKSGKVRPLGVTSNSRSPVAPDIPTIQEQGLAEYDVRVWFGILAPAHTPNAIVAKLNTEINKIFKDESFRAAMLKLGVDLWPSSPEEFSQLIRDETVRWAKIIKDSGAKVD